MLLHSPPKTLLSHAPSDWENKKNTHTHRKRNLHPPVLLTGFYWTAPPPTWTGPCGCWTRTSSPPPAHHHDFPATLLTSDTTPPRTAPCQPCPQSAPWRRSSATSSPAGCAASDLGLHRRRATWTHGRAARRQRAGHERPRARPRAVPRMSLKLLQQVSHHNVA